MKENSNLQILIVEDDLYFAIGLKKCLQLKGHITHAQSLAKAQEYLSENVFDICITDMDLGLGNDGLKVIKLCRDKDLSCLVLSSTDNEQITESAYNLGCRHFLSKIKYKEYLSFYVDEICNKNQKVIDDFFKKSFVTQSSKLIEEIKTLLGFNLKNKRVLITGETGVGKSLLGELIHKTQFLDQSYIHLNCSELAENLLESELFGHKKGAFTGASSDKIGLLERAHNGLLFLDEIATMSMSMQKKLLNALENGTFYPVGSNRAVKTNFTLISATCEDLIEKINEGSFRKDLYFRISGLNLHISALKKRPQDIKLLIKHFLKHSPRKIIIKDEAIDYLCRLDWPGNTRQLKREIDNLTLSKKGIISIEDVSVINESNSETESILSKDQFKFITNIGLRQYMSRVEREVIKEVLNKNNGKVAKTIKDLKISSSAFYRVQQSI